MIEQFIQFGWNVAGFVFATVALLFIASVVWNIFTGFFDWLSEICERNGWN